MEMKLYNSTKVALNECPGCAYAKNRFQLPCDNAFEDDLFTVTQDWELPINGFIIIAPKRHVELFTELDKNEQTELFNLIDLTLTSLRELNICQEYNVIFEEKQGVHFHVWLMPRHDWMQKMFGNPTKHISEVFTYAKSKLKTQDKINEINQTVEHLKNYFMENNICGNIEK